MTTIHLPMTTEAKYQQATKHLTGTGISDALV
jgi:hypothetical protein